MSPDRWRQVEQLYHSAMEKGPVDRAAFLKAACNEDEELRREVESLLEQSDTGLLDRPLQLGPYQIEGVIGAGGMGTVYKARDTRLDRIVAIKVSEARFSARFEREARAVAALNHPHICTLYDVGPNYLVMEYVEGVPLHGPLPVTEVLRLAIQIADALATAHRKGIVHRDLKPGNVLVTKAGVKVLDFGLAKMAEFASSKEEETRTVQPQTEEGAIVGTAAYMSPEQAEGKPVDARSDIFSFGAVLYEMVTGKRAFRGDTKLSVLSAILKDEPRPASSVRKEVPHELEKIITRCLRKDPERRFQHMGDVGIALEEVKEESDSGTAAIKTAPPRRRYLVPSLLGLAILLAGFVLGAIVVASRQGAAAFQFTPFATEAMDQVQPAWSPDGQTMAYAGSVNGVSQIFTRSLSSTVPAQITKASVACSSPFWSSEGNRVYYASQGGLWSVSATGGAAQLVADGDIAPYRSTISPDGKTLAFFRIAEARWTLWTSSASGENPRHYKQAPFPESFRFGQALRFSPDSRKLLVNLEEQIGAEGGNIFWIVPFPAGKPRRIPGRLPSNIRQSGFSWMPDNRHVVFGAEIGEGSGSHLYSLDTQSGAVQPITASTSEELDPSISPDGKRIAFASGSQDWDLVEVWVDHPATSVLLATSRREHSPAWAPSGHQYAYVSDAGGIPEIWLRSVAEGWARPVVTGHAEGFLTRSLPRFSPDGQRLAYVRMALKHQVWISNLAGGREVPLEQESTDQHAAAWSPDGNWIAYFRFVGGHWEVAKAPSGGASHPVGLAEGGNDFGRIDWSPSGEWIAYTDARGLYLVSPDGKAQRLLRKSPPPSFGFSKDGARIYLVRRAPTRAWELAAISVPGGVESKVSDLALPPDVAVAGFSLHPDGKRFATAIGTLKRDIWILEGFRPSAGWLGWLRRQ